MARSRITFFIILAIVLSIVGLSAATSLISSGAILQLYIATAIFGIGVVALDFLGILGEHGQDGDGAIDIDGGDVGSIEADGGADFDAAVDADFDAAIDVDSGVDGLGVDGPGVHISGTEFDGGDATEVHVDGHYTDFDKSTGSWILSLMAYLRLTVYFCMGFGPTGWVALSTGRPPVVSLVIASAVGIVSLFLAQAFFRLQQSYTDSSLSSHDLLRQEATVMIPVGHKDMGKVRIQLGMSVTEQYALASNPNDAFRSGDKVHITRVTDECVYVA